MRLSQFKSKQKSIKAMIYIDNRNNIATVYDNFEDVKERQYGEVIEIYHPSKEDKAWILEQIQKQFSVEKGEAKAELGTEMIYELLGKLTDVPLDLDIEKDRELIEEIVNDPSDILLAIKDELDMICNSLFIRFFNQLMELNKYPKTLVNGMAQLAKENKVIETELETTKQLKEISEELLKSLE